MKKKMEMESQWDTLPPKIQEKILFYKELKERDKLSKVINERRGSFWQTVQKLAHGMAKKKKLYDVLDTRVKMEIVMAELEYGNLGFCPKLVSSVKKRFKEELAKMDKIEKIRFEIEFAEHWVFAW